MSSEVEADCRLPRRILSIDGGGMLGTFPAAVLAEIEQHLDYPIGSYFDLIAGTSTGGIIAIGLAMGLKASELLHLYETKGPAIFGQNHSAVLNFAMRKVRSLRQMYRCKYGSEALKAALINVLGERRIGDAKTRLLVPAWSPVAKTGYIYKTAHDVRLRTDYKAPAVDAALATSAAPTYFRQHLGYRDAGLVDGGIWANNPIALAVTEAIGVLGWPATSLHILSLGCLEEVYSVPKSGGIGTLGRKVIGLFMDGQSHGAMGMAKLLTGDVHKRKAIYRIDHHVPAGKYRMDDALQANGLPFPSNDYGVHWRVVNTDAEATKCNGLRGGFYPSHAHGVRWESTLYRGAHWVEAFVVLRRTRTVIGKSDRFFVVIE